MKALKSACILIVLAYASTVLAGDDYTRLRRQMLERQIKARGIGDKSVLRAMGKVKRHELVSPSYRSRAYADYPLPIGEGQTISQPYVVAFMTEALGLGPEDRVLEIGTGSGYQAAVLAEIVKEVYTIEIRPALATTAKGNLRRLGYGNIHFKVADGYYGWKDRAPFDAIIITAFANHIPPPLIEQLRLGGRLILPLGNTTFSQTLTMATKKGHGDVKLKLLGGVSFVPMTGRARGE
jgi:protein-L-isoaspartate(D-aspartate) O-methyltransferase